MRRCGSTLLHEGKRKAVSQSVRCVTRWNALQFGWMSECATVFPRLWVVSVPKPVITFTKNPVGRGAKKCANLFVVVINYVYVLQVAQKPQGPQTKSTYHQQSNRGYYRFWYVQLVGNMCGPAYGLTHRSLRWVFVSMCKSQSCLVPHCSFHWIAAFPRNQSTLTSKVPFLASLGYLFTFLAVG